MQSSPDWIVDHVPLEDGLSWLNPARTEAYPLWSFGTKVRSQNTEDGVLYYVFSVVGTRTRTCVEICAGDGMENNTAHLILRHGFRGLLFDGDATSIAKGRSFYASQGRESSVRMVASWITRDNIADLVRVHLPPEWLDGASHEIDLLSLDIDGNDYWILQALLASGVIRPRVIIAEIQDILGPDRAWTIPYDPQFQANVHDTWGGPNYAGASYRAFMHLLGKDYALVGCERLGFNAVFVLRSEMRSPLVEMTDLSPIFSIPKVRFGVEQRWPRVQNKPWEDVTHL